MNGKAKNNSILLDQKQNKKKNRTAAECLFVITFFLCDCHWFGFFQKYTIRFVWKDKFYINVSE